jgi:hypothetical protein
LSSRAILRAAAILLALQGTAALACGHCVEDKIAAVYNHAVVTQALNRKHQIAFFAIDGTLVPGVGTQRAIEAIVQSAAGVDKGSARVSVESASLSVAFDPRRRSFAAVQRALERKLSVKNLLLLPLRVMDQPATLKSMK